MTRTRLILLAAGGSAALLLGALAFQYLGGLAPCKLCIWQRWPHGVAIGAGVLALLAAPRLFAAIGAMAVSAGAGIALYHTGIERRWWAGPESCTGSGGGLGSLSGTDLLSMEGPLGVVLCDEVAWEMWGLSMASWNGLLSLGLAALWLLAARAQASSSASQ